MAASMEHQVSELLRTLSSSLKVSKQQKRLWSLTAEQLEKLNKHLSCKLVNIAKGYYQADFVEMPEDLERLDGTLDNLLYNIYLVTATYRKSYGAELAKIVLPGYDVFPTGSMSEGLVSINPDIDMMACCKAYVVTDQMLKTKHSKTKHSKTKHSKTEHSKTEHSKTEHSKTEQEHSKTEHSKTEHSKTEHSKTENSKTENSKTEQEHSKEVIHLQSGTDSGFVIVPESYTKLLNPDINNPLLTKHGPAMVGVTEKDSIGPALEIEITRCIKVNDWPEVSREWLQRKRNEWPDRQIIDKCMEIGCHIVYKQHPLNKTHLNEWRYSMSLVEIALAHTFNEYQRRAYIISKYILKHYLFKQKEISSYHLKTAMFWLCEQKDTSSWRNQSLSENVLDIIKTLRNFLNEKNIPNFFIRDCNMIGHFTGDFLNERVKLLDSLLTDLMGCLNFKLKKEDLLRESKLPFNIDQLADTLNADKDDGIALTQLRFQTNYLFLAMSNFANNMPSTAAKEVIWKVQEFVNEASNVMDRPNNVSSDVENPQCNAVCVVDQPITELLSYCDKECIECSLIFSHANITYNVICTLASLINDDDTFLTRITDGISDINQFCESFALCIMVLVTRSKEQQLSRLINSLMHWENNEDYKNTLLCHCFYQVLSHGDYMVNKEKEVYLAERDRILYAINMVQKQLNMEDVRKGIIAAWNIYRSNIIESIVCAYYSQYSLDANWLIVDAILSLCYHITLNTNPNNSQYHLLNIVVRILMNGSTCAVKEVFHFVISAISCLIIFSRNYDGLQKLANILDLVEKRTGKESGEILSVSIQDLSSLMSNPLAATDACLEATIKRGAALTAVTDTLEYVKYVAVLITEEFGLPSFLASVGLALFYEDKYKEALMALEEAHAILDDRKDPPPPSQVALMAHIYHIMSFSVDTEVDHFEKAGKLFESISLSDDFPHSFMIYLSLYLIRKNEMEKAIQILVCIADANIEFREVNVFYPDACNAMDFITEIQKEIKINKKKIFFSSSLAFYLLIHLEVAIEENMKKLKYFIVQLKMFLRTNLDPVQFDLVQCVADSYLLNGYAEKRIGDIEGARESFGMVKKIDKSNLLVDKNMEELGTDTDPLPNHAEPNPESQTSVKD